MGGSEALTPPRAKLMRIIATIRPGSPAPLWSMDGMEVIKSTITPICTDCIMLATDFNMMLNGDELVRQGQ
jgi:hypothetical protein